MKHVVEVWEHDSWSGISLSYKKTYRHRRSAVRYRNQINGRNTAKVVPDSYSTANLKGEGGPITRYHERTYCYFKDAWRCGCVGHLSWALYA